VVRIQRQLNVILFYLQNKTKKLLKQRMITMLMLVRTPENAAYFAVNSSVLLAVTVYWSLLPSGLRQTNLLTVTINALTIAETICDHFYAVNRLQPTFVIEELYNAAFAIGGSVKLCSLFTFA